MSPSFDHRAIAKELDLYLVNERAGQGLPILLPNWVIIRNKIIKFLQKKQKEFGFQEVITPILGSAELYQTSGHLDHYQNYMFPAISRENETLYLRPMTCPHHCLIFQQKTRSYRDLPLRLCENSILHRYEASGGLKGLERTRWFELADHHIFTTPKQLKEELKRNYRYIDDILTTFFSTPHLVCALHDPNNLEKYHPDQKIWEFSENLLTNSLNELGLEGKYKILTGEAAFYGPKLDFEVQAADGKNITIATIQLDFVLPQKFGLNYTDKEEKKQTPVIIHQSPFGSYQRFIALLLEQTEGKLPFWLAPCQVAILPVSNKEEEIKNYCQKLTEELEQVNLRVKIFSKGRVNERVLQVHQKKTPYFLVVGEKETKTKTLKLVNTYKRRQEEELTEKELVNKLSKENQAVKL